MSRLESVIRRLSAQRDCLDVSVGKAPPGAFLEVGLGNGRTHDHLREIAPDRRIWVIDRGMNAHPSSAPEDDLFLEGEAEAMLDTLHDRIGRNVALAHYDLGIGVPELDAPLRDSLAEGLVRLLVPGGLLVANGPFPFFEELPLPETVAPGRYFIYRAS